MSRQFFKNAAFLSLVEIILKLKGFIFIPLLTRHFGTINYGVWSQVAVLVTTLGPIIVLGTDAAIIRYLPGKPINEQKRQYIAWAIFLLFISITLCSLLLLFKRPLSYLFFGSSGEYLLFIPLAAATLLVSLSINTLRNWYRVQNNAKVYGYIALTQATLNTVALICNLIMHKGVYELVMYSLIADFLVVALLLVYFTYNFGWARPDFTIIKTLVKYGFPIIPAGYAMLGLNSMDRLFLVKYSTMAEIGIYSLCYSLGFMIIQVFVSPIWNMYPNMASQLFNNNKMDDMQRLFEKSVGIILLIAVPATVGMFVLGKQLLAILATPEFITGSHVMAIITVGYLFHVLSSYYDVALGLVQKQHLSTISISIAFLMNLLLNFLLIPKYGILGAAIATSVAFLFQFILSFSLASYYTQIKSSFSFPIKILSTSMVMGIGIYILSNAIPGKGLIKLFSLVALGSIFYAALLLLFRVIKINQLKSCRL